LVALLYQEKIQVCFTRLSIPIRAWALVFIMIFVVEKAVKSH